MLESTTTKIGTARERTIQAVEYYNNNVLRARVGAGLAGARASVSERHLMQNRTKAGGGNLYGHNTENLYRSNSSLELLHDHVNLRSDFDANPPASGSLRREYGSHGSIHVISSERRTPTTGESFFAMLQDYRPAVLNVIGVDQRSPGPDDPKLLTKLHKIWGPTKQGRSQGHEEINNSTVLSGSQQAPTTTTHNSLGYDVNAATAVDIEERQRRQSFAHYDCQSLTANLIYAAKLRSVLLARRRNTTTGASAASMVNSRSSTPDGAGETLWKPTTCPFQGGTRPIEYVDCGAKYYRHYFLGQEHQNWFGIDEELGPIAISLKREKIPPNVGGGCGGGGGNQRIAGELSIFRNEIGGEKERNVSITRIHTPNPPGQCKKSIHIPVLACGLSILECGSGETLWKPTTCPFQGGTRPIEYVDCGAKYYRHYFLGQEHQNWFGIDEELGPIAISLKREKIPPNVGGGCGGGGGNVVAGETDGGGVAMYQFRVIVRTSELLTLRGSILEESIPNPRGAGKSLSTKDVLEYVAPEVQIPSLRLSVGTPQCEHQLVKLDEQCLTTKYKVGILYCKSGQNSEEDMYNNMDASAAFDEFLECLGKKVRLKGFEHYKAGLDNKTDSTGTHSLYSMYQNCEVMFHVSTMLPYTPNNRQQLLRKRHIGNDIVTIVFQEHGALPFTPKNIRSQFQHVFVIVQAVNPCTDNTHYRVAVARSKQVPVFGPPLRAGALYPKGKTFVDFLLAKVINAENAAHRSEKFVTMATRTRQEYLKDIISNYSTTTVVDTGPKFSIFPSKKKEKPKPRFRGDLSQRGAFCWHVVLHDSETATTMNCFLGISAETFVLIDEGTRQVVFVTPTRSILGWSTNGNLLRIYHHQGECITLNMYDYGERDEQLEVIERLRAVTPGCGALELNLYRNPLGQLGFHVQPDGVVTQVEMSGQAWAAGLRQGYRLVEICKIAVATLSHEQMVDLLKTSAQVTVTVIESFADRSPRRGCFYQNCKFNIMNYDEEYEKNLSSTGVASSQHQHASVSPVTCLRQCERNFSPPRSSNSSGYGTGSSYRSFTVPIENSRSAPDMGTLTSSSSGHSSNDGNWYDVLHTDDDSSVIKRRNSKHAIQQYHRQPKDVLNARAQAMASVKVHQDKDGGGGGSATKRPVTFDPSQFPRVDYAQIQKDHTANASKDHSDVVHSSTNSLEKEFKRPALPHHEASEVRSQTPQEAINGITMGKIHGNSAGKMHPDGRPVSEPKLRSGSRPGTQYRNSVHYTGSSSLQEDLMKLIDPDYAQSTSEMNKELLNLEKEIQNSANLRNMRDSPNIMTNLMENLDLMRTKSRSREGINFGSTYSALNALQLSGGKQDDEKSDENMEVIFTVARPATVLSSNSEGTSPALDTRRSQRGAEQRNGDNADDSGGHQKGDTKDTVDLRNLPLLTNTNDMNWSTLVDTATKAILQSKALGKETPPLKLNEYIDGSELKIDRRGEREVRSMVNTPEKKDEYRHTGYEVSGSVSLPELQTQVSQLEDLIIQETRRRKSLECAVKRLTEENKRLQDESQAAVQQLRRFTEWFFQTIVPSTNRDEDVPFTIIVPKVDTKSVDKDRLREFLLEHIIPGIAFQTFTDDDVYGNGNYHKLAFTKLQKDDEMQWFINGVKILRMEIINERMSVIFIDGFLGDKRSTTYSKRNIQETNRYNEPQRLEMKNTTKHEAMVAKDSKISSLMNFLSGMKTGTKVFQHFLSKSNLSYYLNDVHYVVLIPTDNAFQRWHPIDWGFYPFSVHEFTESVLRNHFIQLKTPLRMEDIKRLSEERKFKTLGGETVVFRNIPSPTINNVTILSDFSLVNGNQVFLISEVLFVSEAIVSRLHQMHKDKETPPLLAFPWFGAQFLSHSFLALERDSRFTQITRWLNTAEIAPFVSGSNYTFFVPMDAAFEKIGYDVLPDTVLASEEGIRMLLNHFVRGRLYDRDLKHDEVFETMGGGAIRIERSPLGNVTVNGAHIIEKEHFVYNLGTMFYIDSILYWDLVQGSLTSTTDAPLMSSTQEGEVERTTTSTVELVDVKREKEDEPSLAEDDLLFDEDITPRALPVRFQVNSPK
uniref:Putative rap1-gtpase-activating protein rap1gap n=1 Tax=Lutzomyia longipalpis TaxID=7200 RepID=A0A1B0CV68_LUTLO